MRCGKGAADRSYGVQVARLAGLPQAVIERAKVVLEALEKGEREGGGQKALIDDLPLFRAAPAAGAAGRWPRLGGGGQAAQRVLPDELTPEGGAGA